MLTFSLFIHNINIVYYFFATCSFYLRIVYSVLHIFVLLPHVANKLNHCLKKAHHTVNHKKRASKLLPIYSPNIDRF